MVVAPAVVGLFLQAGVAGVLGGRKDGRVVVVVVVVAAAVGPEPVGYRRRGQHRQGGCWMLDELDFNLVLVYFTMMVHIQ